VGMSCGQPSGSPMARRAAGYVIACCCSHMSTAVMAKYSVVACGQAHGGTGR
jgi:hypothetical protein